MAPARKGRFYRLVVTGPSLGTLVTRLVLFSILNLPLYRVRYSRVTVESLYLVRTSIPLSVPIVLGLFWRSLKITRTMALRVFEVD